MIQPEGFTPKMEVRTKSWTVCSDWWALFQSPALDQLVRRALQRNPTVQAADAALRVAQENANAQRGIFYPSVAASFSPSRQRVATGSVTSPVASNDTVFSLHTAQVTVAYTLDVFGANRRQVESLDALALAQRHQLEAAYLSLSANVVAGAIQEASLRAQIEATERLIAIQQEQLQLFRIELKSGAIAESNVIAQEASLALTRALLSPLRKQLAQQRDTLVALCGDFPSLSEISAFNLADLHLPQRLPLTLPSQLVDQRPDVRAAEEELHSAAAQIGVATANMLPQFTLGAGAGSIATTLGQLFRSGNTFWNVAGAVTAPLFDGGTLIHRRLAAEAAYDQAAAQYRATVVSAFQDVADALQALQIDAQGLQDSATAEASAASGLAIARKQVELGDASYLMLLASDQAYQQAEIGLVQARASRMADTAALFQALGGGWWQTDGASTK